MYELHLQSNLALHSALCFVLCVMRFVFYVLFWLHLRHCTYCTYRVIWHCTLLCVLCFVLCILCFMFCFGNMLHVQHCTYRVMWGCTLLCVLALPCLLCPHNAMSGEHRKRRVFYHKLKSLFFLSHKKNHFRCIGAAVMIEMCTGESWKDVLAINFRPLPR